MFVVGLICQSTDGSKLAQTGHLNFNVDSSIVIGFQPEQLAQKPPIWYEILFSVYENMKALYGEVLSSENARLFCFSPGKPGLPPHRICANAPLLR